MKLQKLDQVKKLEIAAKLIESVVNSLDRSSTACVECGKHHYHNWQDYNSGPQLQSCVEKLRKIAIGFRTNPSGERIERMQPKDD